MSRLPSDHDHRDAHETVPAVWAVVLIALSALMLRLWQDGALVLYVHPGFVPYVALTAYGLIVLALALLWRLYAVGRTTRSLPVQPVSWSVLALAAAVLIAGFVPARPLGSALAAVQDGGVPPPALLPLTEETATWTLLEWAQALNGGVRRERLLGRQVSVLGFVHRPQQGAVPGEFLVTRFVVRCCAADGMAVSLRVRSPDADTLAADTWVQVDGVLRRADKDADATVYVEADQLTVAPTPSTPYLSPV